MSEQIENNLYQLTSGWIGCVETVEMLPPPSFCIVKASRDNLTRTFCNSERLICIEIQPVFKKFCNQSQEYNVQ